ncbi:DinB family protein [Hylemonella sp. W303a]|uniref:DinB family protein n=1 Tax=Hylemonella sp. W303a TaxID=3389873 RepID=UPI00396B3604
MNQLTLAALAAFPDQLSSLYESFPLASKHFAPASWEGVPSEPLTAIEQICHVLDIEVEGYQVRIQRTLNEWNPVLPSLDTEAMARDRLYHRKEAAAVLRDFRRARSETVGRLQALTAEQLERPAQFEGYGQVTLQSLVHYLCSHDQQHLSGLQWLLGKLSSPATKNAA